MKNSSKQLFAFAIFIAFALTTSPAFSSQEFDWKAGPNIPGNIEFILASTVWDPDGNGPLKPLLILAGSFASDSNNIIAWDGKNFHPLGSGTNGLYNNVLALTVYKGQLIAAGKFTQIGGIAANRIAAWDGTNWHPLGTGMDRIVSSLTIYNGDIIAGGIFVQAGGLTVNCIARWDGNNWHPLGDGPGGDVYALTVYKGKLIAGGSIFYWGCQGINQWDGSQWQGLGKGVNDQVNALIIWNDLLIVGGFFDKADNISARGVASWDGNYWHSLGEGVNLNGFVKSLACHNHKLIIGGRFSSAGNVDSNCIAAWDDSGWNSLGSGMSGGSQQGTSVNTLVTYEGQLLAGGDFYKVNGLDAHKLATWTLPINSKGDLNYNCKIDESDLQLLSEKWLNADCLYNGWCEEADLNYDTKVDLLDFAVFANHWLQEIIDGDFNGDNHENFEDYSIFAKTWTALPGQTNWNPSCDISEPKDDVIDLKDLSVFASNWLKGV